MTGVVMKLIATALSTALLVAVASAASQGQDGTPLEFTHVLDDSPLDVLTPREREEFSDAVKQFHVSGENPYSGDEAVIAESKKIYEANCRACHGIDGAGGMGPALKDQTVRRERAATHKGMFEIIYGGSAGAMQPFAKRLDQDEILRVMAYVESLGAAE